MHRDQRRDRTRGHRAQAVASSFERVFGRKVPTREAPRRPGDAVGAFANVDKARDVLGWESGLTLDQAITSAVAWAERRHEILGYL